MNHLELLHYSLTVGFIILLCAFVYFRRLQWHLPFFTAYSTVLLACTVGVSIFYHFFGFRSEAAFNAYWVAVGLVIVARSIAIMELCRYELRAYHGIWSLTWRILALLAVLFLGHAAFDAWGQAGGIAIYGLTIQRDLAISCIVILLAMLLIRNYYGLTLEPLHMWIATGMLIVSIIDTINTAILRDTFTGHLVFWFFRRYGASWSSLRPQVEGATELWNRIHTLGEIASISIWCFALRKPLPAPSKEPVLLPAEIYNELSPAVNLRLRAFNNRLSGMLKS